jgi:5,10-methylenetetrahydromethanopterin reductase
VPVEVVATGPKALAVAARTGDRVLLAVGADPERVGWAAGVARASGAARLAAFVNVVAHPDVAVARRLAAGGLTTFARFSAMDGKVHTPIDADSQRVLEDVHGAYDMNRHTRGGSPQAARLTDAFIDRFGVVGPADHCVARLTEIAKLGVDRLIVVGPSIDADRDAARVALQTFVREVLPALRTPAA